jgi:hypothetical protein
MIAAGLRTCRKMLLGAAAGMLAMLGAHAGARDSLSYWSCTGDRWTAVGWPNYPAPIARCGGTGDGTPADTEERCEAAGGIWGPIGLFPEPVCVQKTIDAGRYCRDAGECASTCDAELTKEQHDIVFSGRPVRTGGACWGVTPLIGCHAMVEKGWVQGVLCID